MNKKIFLLFLLFIFPLNNFGQTEIYMDENLKTIDSTLFFKKCQAQIFKCFTYKTDSIKINKILHKYAFGKIKPIEANQLRLLLTQRANIKIDSSSTLVITYRDTLYGYAHRLASQKKHIKKVNEGKFKEPTLPQISGNIKVRQFKHNHPPYTREKYNSTFKKTVKNQDKCIKKTERKFPVKIFYTYKYDKGFLKDFPKHWVKDNGIIKNSFFKIMYESHLVIIKPNGEYFLGGSHLSDDNFNNIIKTDNWASFKRDWKNSILSNNKKGLGIFKKSVGPHNKHCF